MRSRQVRSSGVRGGKVTPEDVSISDCHSTRGRMGLLAGFLSSCRMVRDWPVPLVISETEL